MNGIIVINKEQDYTSRDVVNIVSKVLNTKKVGHTGTLDPLATGVLVICVGQATKLVDLLNGDKEYIAEVVLGVETDTLDITGNVIKEEIVSKTKDEIELVLKKFQKKYIQQVPLYSAVKVNGKKLYEYARNNEQVILPKKEVEIKEIELLDYKTNDKKTTFKFKCLVTKGTYIRSLIKDIAESLNTFGTMTGLVRTKTGEFDIEKAYNIEEIKNNKFEMLKPLPNMLNFPKILVDDKTEKTIKNGALLENKYSDDKILFINQNDDLLAIYQTYEKNNRLIKPWKVF